MQLRTHPIERSACLLLLLLGLLTAGYSLYTGFQWRVHIPIADQLHQLSIVQRVLEDGFTAVPLKEWVELHAGAHRIAFIRFGMAIDYLYFGGQNHFIHFTSLFCLVAALACCAYFAFDAIGEKETTALAAIGIALFWFLSPTQLTNWANPINNSWLLAHGLIVGAFFLTTVTERLSASSICIAFILCVAASLSTFSGVPAIILLQALVLLRAFRTGLLLLPVSAVTLMFLLDGVVTGDTLIAQYAPQLVKDTPVLTRALEHAVDVGTYMSSPLSIYYPSAGVVVAFLSIGFLSWQGTLALRENWLNGPKHSRFKAFCLFVGLACLAVGVACSLGRTMFAAPTAARYQTFVCLYWLNISLLLISIQPTKQRLLLHFRFIIVFVLISFFLVSAGTMNTRALQAVTLADEFIERAHGDGIQGMNYGRLLSMGGRDYYKEYDEFFRKYQLAHYKNSKDSS